MSPKAGRRAASVPHRHRARPSRSTAVDTCITRPVSYGWQANASREWVILPATELLRAPSARTFENPLRTRFGEPDQGEVRGTPLRRTPVNMAKITHSWDT